MKFNISHDSFCYIFSSYTIRDNIIYIYIYVVLDYIMKLWGGFAQRGFRNSELRVLNFWGEPTAPKTTPNPESQWLNPDPCTQS